jgi:adenine-specific DNA-methyltransferase
MKDAIEQKLSIKNGEPSHDLMYFRQTIFKGVSPKSFDGLREYLLKEAITAESLIEDSEIAESLSDEQLEELQAKNGDHDVSRDSLLAEAETILGFIALSRSIVHNTKGNALITTLRKQFEKAKNEGWPEKAVIFTEFRSTQDYVLTALEQAGIDTKGDVVIFNGSAGDVESRRLLVEEFKSSKRIFLTTEAGAEGLNLQFCNLIINYDLPWNPQRIEQRIGRCHRYGQKLDVVVVNFVNEKNLADKRILELLDQKFQLFRGAFGVSDEVLGEIESGTDIEREIFKIYLSCRSEDEIKDTFEKMLEVNKDRRDAKIAETKSAILSTFDEEVQRKLKAFHGEVQETIDRKQAIVRDLVLSSLPVESYSYDGRLLHLRENWNGLETGKAYTFAKTLQSEAELLHIGHPSIQRFECPVNLKGAVKFRTGRHNISSLRGATGKAGFAFLFRAGSKGIEEKEMLIPIVFLRDAGSSYSPMEPEAAARLFEVTSELVPSVETVPNDLEELAKRSAEEASRALRGEMETYNTALYEEESQKIEFYFQDIQDQRRLEIQDLEKKLTELKKERAKLPLNAAQRINGEIQRIKDKIIKLEESIAEARRQARDEEKDLLSNLDQKATLSDDLRCVLAIAIAIE